MLVGEGEQSVRGLGQQGVAEDLLGGPAVREEEGGGAVVADGRHVLPAQLVHVLLHRGQGAPRGDAHLHGGQRAHGLQRGVSGGAQLVRVVERRAVQVHGHQAEPSRHAHLTARGELL